MKRKKNKLDWHSIRVKSFLYFLLLSASIVTFLLFFAINFFEPIYKQAKQKEIERVCNVVIDAYINDKLESALTNEINPNEVDALLFKVEEDTGVVIFNGTRVNEDNLLYRMQTFLTILANSKSNSASFVMDENTTRLLCYGQVKEIEGQTLYFLTSTRLTPVAITLKILGSSIWLILFGSIIIAGVLSYIFSNSIASPLQKMSMSARALSKTDLNIHFNGDGYTESEQLSEILNFAIDELKKTDELRNELVSNVSHELKTPLTMIKSYAELIKDINGDNKVKREANLDVIIEEANRLETLLSDMLDFSKLKSGTIDYNFTDFNLSSLIINLVQKYQTKYNSNGYNFILDCPENVMVKADYNRIEQVITNLLNNAINYSKTNKEITIQLLPTENNKCKLSIIDKGIGIPAENIPHIFERHFRATNAERVSVGSGIGLSIVKQILDDHRLEFGVKSKLNEGSTFYIIFKTLDFSDNKETNNEKRN